MISFNFQMLLLTANHFIYVILSIFSVKKIISSKDKYESPTVCINTVGWLFFYAIGIYLVNLVGHKTRQEVSMLN